MRTDEAVARRFWNKVNRDGPVPSHCQHLGPCSVWTAATAAGRYGKFRIDGVHYGSHRVSWSLANGEIPDGLLVLHKCDNMRCVRIDHLFLGTHKDNVADMLAKGRKLVGDAARELLPENFGELNAAAKLTTADVRAIRSATGRQVDIAAKFGVTQTTVSRIKRREQHGGWSHVD